MQSASGYSSEKYRATFAATGLAICKLIEGCGAAWLLKIILTDVLAGNTALLRLANQLQGAAGETATLVRDGAAFWMVMDITVAVILGLVALECLGVVLLRVAGIGNGLVRLVHGLAVVAIVLALILAALALFGMFQGMNDVQRLIRLDGVLTIVIVLLSFTVNLDYHRGVCRLMKMIKRERRSRQWEPVRKTRVAAIADFLVGCGALMIACTLTCWFLWERLQTDPGFLGLSGSGIGAFLLPYVELIGQIARQSLLEELAVTTFFTLKYAFVAAAVRGYVRAHYRVD